MNVEWRGTRRRILMLAGTDIHPFHRMREWADARASEHPSEDVLLQHGYTPPPDLARGVQILAPAQLAEIVEGADIVIAHGGPGTLSAVRSAGIRPIVFPRDPAHGEHVDDHQLRFARWAGERGLATVVTQTDGLDAAIVSFEETSTAASPLDEVRATVASLRGRVDELAHGRRFRWAVPRLPQFSRAER